MSKLLVTIKDEAEKLLPPTLFFFFILHLISVLRGLMLSGTGISLESSASITLAALVLGKAVLIADMLPFINRYPDKPLMFNVVWKTFIYLLVAALLHYLERLIEFWREAGGLVAANEKMLAEMVWPHFWAVQILLLVLILFYCTAHEFVRVIGRDKVMKILFVPPGSASI